MQVGMRAVKVRKSMPKKRQPALLKTLVDSLPMFMYSMPIRMPIARCDTSRSRVSVFAHRTFAR